MSPNGLAPADPGASHATHAWVPSQGGPDLPEPPGPLLAAGLAADVYAVSDEQVLRRYREGRDASAEVALLRHVAAHGFPAPAAEHLGGPDLLMERVHGPTLLQALAAGEVDLRGGAQILVDLHDQLHRIAAPGGDGVVVHLDLHPGNVILTERRGPVLVDWALARAGTAGLDVAVTALVLAEVAVDAGGDYSQAARALLAAFLGIAGEDPVPALDEAIAVRCADPALVTGECDLVEPAADLVRRFVALTVRA